MSEPCDTTQQSSQIKTVSDFCIEVMVEYGTLVTEGVHERLEFDYLTIPPSKLAKDFIEYFKIQHPLELSGLMEICINSNIQLDLSPSHHKARGWHASHKNGRYIIYFKEDDPPASQIHTILHELYEIIIEKLSGKCFNSSTHHDGRLESKADQFAAYVHVSHAVLFDWINERGLDVLGIQKYLGCSYGTALIRLNETLCSVITKDTEEFIPHIGLLFERPFWQPTPSGRIPRHRFAYFTKSRGFKFLMSKDAAKNILLGEDSKELGLFPNCRPSELVKMDYDLFIPDLTMKHEENKLQVDVLMRCVRWRKSKYAAKVLIQIMPVEHTSLRILAEKLNVTTMDFASVVTKIWS